MWFVFFEIYEMIGLLEDQVLIVIALGKSNTNNTLYLKVVLQIYLILVKEYYFKLNNVTEEDIIFQLFKISVTY